MMKKYQDPTMMTIYNDASMNQDVGVIIHLFVYILQHNSSDNNYKSPYTAKHYQ